MQFYNSFANRQPETEATELTSDFHASLLEKVKNTRQHFRRNADAAILYLQFPRPPDCQAVVIRIVPFSGVNLIPLVSKFKSTC